MVGVLDYDCGVCIAVVEEEAGVESRAGLSSPGDLPLASGWHPHVTPSGVEGCTMQMGSFCGFSSLLIRSLSLFEKSMSHGCTFPKYDPS